MAAPLRYAPPIGLILCLLVAEIAFTYPSLAHHAFPALYFALRCAGVIGMRCPHREQDSPERGSRDEPKNLRSSRLSRCPLGSVTSPR